jgi:hypothetical protein
VTALRGPPRSGCDSSAGTRPVRRVVARGSAQRNGPGAVRVRCRAGAGDAGRGRGCAPGLPARRSAVPAVCRASVRQVGALPGGRAVAPPIRRSAGRLSAGLSGVRPAGLRPRRASVHQVVAPPPRRPADSPGVGLPGCRLRPGVRGGGPFGAVAWWRRPAGLPGGLVVLPAVPVCGAGSSVRRHGGDVAARTCPYLPVPARTCPYRFVCRVRVRFFARRSRAWRRPPPRATRPRARVRTRRARCRPPSPLPARAPAHLSTSPAGRFAAASAVPGPAPPRTAPRPRAGRADGRPAPRRAGRAASYSRWTL